MVEEMWVLAIDGEGATEETTTPNEVQVQESILVISVAAISATGSNRPASTQPPALLPPTAATPARPVPCFPSRPGPPPLRVRRAQGRRPCAAVAPRRPRPRRPVHAAPGAAARTTGPCCPTLPDAPAPALRPGARPSDRDQHPRPSSRPDTARPATTTRRAPSDRDQAPGLRPKRCPACRSSLATRPHQPGCAPCCDSLQPSPP
eukprot:XP_020393612.1 uncharacterized protein LOC109939709 [Zea mays]